MPEAAYFAAAEWAAFAGYGSTASTVIGAAAYVGTAVAISYAASELLAPSANKVANTQSRALGTSVSNAQGVIGGAATSTTIRQSAAPRRLIFGTVKTGGVLVYAKKTPDEYELHLAIYLGEGIIQGITGPVFLGDKTSDDYSGLVDTEVFIGAASPARSTSLEAVSEGEWTAAHLGKDCAWVHTTYTFDRDVWDIGPTLPAFTVQGLLCYDPRTGTTPGVATSNPSLALLKFIRSEYGYAAPDEWIDFDSFAVAAGVCDEIIDSLDVDNVVLGVPYKVRRYSLNAVFEVDASPAATVAAIEATCAGKLVFSGGKYRFYAGAYRAPTGPQLTAEYLRADPAFRAHPTRQQRFNIARGTYIEPKQDWQETSIHDQILSAAIVAEDGEIVQSVSLPAVTNSAQAQRLARIAMNTARSAVPTILQCNYAAFQWRLFDVVDLNLPEVGAVGDYLITGYKFADIADGGGIDLTLVPHLASDYAWDHTTQEQLVEEVIAPNMEFPVPDIAGLSHAIGTSFYDGSDQVDRVVYVSWDDMLPDWAILAYYDVEIKQGTGEWQSYQAAEPAWNFEASPDLSYSYRVRAVGLNDKKGSWATGSVSVYRDTSPPDGPTDYGVDGETLARVYWTAPDSSNYAQMRVYTVASSGLGSPVLRDTVAGRPGLPGSAAFAYPAGTHYAIQPESVDGALGTMVYAGAGINNALTLAVDDLETQISDLDTRVTDLESGP